MLDRSDLIAWTAALDALDPPPRDVFGELGYTPTAKQRQFHDATEDVILFGGSLGGGKSIAAMAEAIRACVLHPGIRVGVFRRTYGELRDALLPPLAKLGFGRTVGGTWNGSEFELRFANGSMAGLRYCENLADATRRQGAEYQLIVFDELNLLNPDAVAFLESRLRSGRADLPVLGIRATANPGGPSHGHVRARFIDATGYGERVAVDDGGRTVRFIPSSMHDNPHLDDGYSQRLNVLPDSMRRAMRDGDWSVFQGQMFTELSRSRHVVDPITLPASWKRYNGIDWGFSKPWCVLWGAVDEDGRVWIYRELYRTLVKESDQARGILDAETADERVTARFADDAMWDTRGEAKAIADMYAENGVYLTKAGKGQGSRVQGWQRIHQYLAEAPACPHHRALGQDTCPMLHLFPTVENLFRELTDLPYATKGNVEDADTDASDHAADALRYLLRNLGTGPDYLLDVPAAPAVLNPEGALPKGQRFGQFARPVDDGDPWRLDDGPERDWTPGAIRQL